MIDRMNSRMKICIIGHFGADKNFTDGQTVKTKEIYNFLLNNTPYSISKVDTYRIKYRFLKKFREVNDAMKKADVIVLIVSSRGYKILAPMIYFLNRKRRKELYDFVIGGNRQNIFAHSSFLLKCAKQYRSIYVETDRILEDYTQNGLKNVQIISNCKNIEAFGPKKYSKQQKTIRLCTFSRVCREKGILDAIYIVKKLNESDETHEYILDIYGNVEKRFVAEFKEALQNSSDFAFYCGSAPSDESSRIISSYDMLLFLTFWPGEGFPGTLLDCFFASTPVISTDWNYNFDILKDGKTGVKVGVGKMDETVEKILRLVNDPGMLEEMSINCYNERMKYTPAIAFAPFVDDLKGCDEKRKR